MSGHHTEHMSSHVRDNGVPGHRVPWELIEQVFAGPVAAPTMAALRDGQHSRRLLLMKVLRELAEPVLDTREAQRAVEDAWRALVATEKHAPAIVREILLFPSVGTWLVRVIRKIRGIIEADVPIWVEMGYLGSVAAAAAIRAGIDDTVTVLVWRGRVTLPTVGQFEVADEDATYVTRLRVKDCAAAFEASEGKWISLDEVPSVPFRRHLSNTGGHAMCWLVDDIDPYRTFTGMASPDRLTATEFEEWCRRLDQAWAIVVEEHADYVPELAAAEPVVVPTRRSGGFVAASSSASVGAIRAVLPDDPAAMAETLLHELQHSKLNALLDLVPLKRPGSSRTCYAPWRRDPRPLSGLLHGIYAFVGVTEYWYRRWRSDAEPTAAFHFVHHQLQVREAIRALGAVPELTEVGARLLEVASARLDACDDTAVPEDLRACAAALCAESRLTWCLRHLAPRAEHIASLADRWLAGEPNPVRDVESVLRPFHRPGPEFSLAALLTVRALDPATPVADPKARAGERELVNGDAVAARSAFAARIRTDPEDDGAWVGLLLAMGGESSPPETVSATYRRIAVVSGAPPDAVSMVEWFAHR